MNAFTVFEDRKDEFLAQLTAAQDAKARMDAAVFILEQIACVLAQEETDSAARQRQQAVLAMAKKAPSLLAAAQAEGELVIVPAQKAKKPEKITLTAKTAGAGILALLAAYALIDGQLIFAALQAAGCALVFLGGGTLGTAAARMGQAQARGVLRIDAKATLEHLGALCRAADVCVSDLAILEKEASLGRLSGTADEATLDLLTSMLEAKASGRSDAAERMLDLAQQYLKMLGMEALDYSKENAAYFDVLPTLSGERTIRPALLREGKLIRRGVAAKQMERSMGA